jgi:hypothetical protein
MSSLTNEFAKLHISAAQQQNANQTRARSKSPVPSHLTSQQYTDEQYYSAPQKQEPPFCNRFLCYGHVTQQCRQQAMVPRQQYAQQQYRQYMPLQFHNTNRFPSYNNQQWQQKGQISKRKLRQQRSVQTKLSRKLGFKLDSEACARIIKCRGSVLSNISSSTADSKTAINRLQLWTI